MSTTTTTAADSGDILTIGEAADYLRISHESAYRFAQRGELPGARKVGGLWRISRAALVSYMVGGEPA